MIKKYYMLKPWLQLIILGKFWKSKKHFLTYSLQAKKIENIQKIINVKDKLKLRLHITSKGLSRKQVIVLISNNNKTKFIIDLNTHIVNINRALKNIKLEVKTNFIWTDQSGLVIVTNKVTAPLIFKLLSNMSRMLTKLRQTMLKLLICSNSNFISK